MIIEHVALYVKDLEVAREFFNKYLNTTSNELYRNYYTGFKSYFLTFSSGSRIEIMYHPKMIDDVKHIRRTGYAHIAISTGSKDNVDALTKVMKDDGYEVLSGPRTTGDGHYESVIVSFENILIEVTV